MLPWGKRIRGDQMPRRLNVQVRAALTDRSGVGVCKDLMPPLGKSVEKRETNQPIPMRFVIGQALGGAVDEDGQCLRQ